MPLLRLLRRLFTNDFQEAEERETAKAAEVDELLVRSDQVLAEKERVVGEFRNVNRDRADRVTAAYRYMDTRRARGKDK